MIAEYNKTLVNELKDVLLSNKSQSCDVNDANKSNQSEAQVRRLFI